VLRRLETGAADPWAGFFETGRRQKLDER
jgi:hypothetical protein